MKSVSAQQVHALLERVMPLPKQATIAGLSQLAAAGCAIAAPCDDPPVQTAVEVLKQAIAGAQIGARGAFVLRLHVLPADPELSALLNADQAYRIRPLTGAQQGLELAGTTGLGVLYAARTLAQMITSAPPLVEIPIATVLDWPDLAERGQWGGDSYARLAETSAQKMNLIEVGVVPKLDASGHVGIAPLTPPVCAAAVRLGVKVVAYVPHLGDLGKYSNIFEFQPGLMSTPNPDEPLPPDYKPNMCLSKPAAAELIARIMTEVITTMAPCGQEMNIWMTEEGTPCFCESCRGQNPYVIEARLLGRAFGLVKEKHPGFKLRILLTQGSYPYNEEVLAVVPPGMGVTFYSGTHTFDSSRRPMIYPVLEDYTRRGGWLAVVPQIDNSWRTVFPFTGLHFMRSRMQEFVAKGLQSVTGYATPSNRFCAANVAGLAEWGWNANGRDDYQFARAWAVRRGIADVAGFAEWACLISPLGWDLAGGRFPMRLFWDPARSILETPTAMVYGDGFLAEIASPEHMERNIARAREALALAETLGRPECVAESQVVLNSHLFLQALVAVSATPRSDVTLHEQLSQRLTALDTAAEGAVCGLWDWACAVYPDTPSRPQHRFEETMSVFAQVVTEAYRFAVEAGIVDPRPAWRDRSVGTWAEKDFRAGEASLCFDVTSYLAGAGPYRVMFRYSSGGYGADILSAALWQGKGRGARRVAHITPKAWGYADNPPAPHIGRYEAWNDVRLDVPALEPAARYYLRVRLGGLPKRGEAPAERRTTRGEICLRRAWA